MMTANRWALALALGLVALAARAAEALPQGPVVTPVFGEIFVHRLPNGFKPQTEQTQGDVYRRTLVLAADPDSGAWTQRLLLSGTRDLGLRAELTPAMFAMQIVKGFQSSCPSSFAGSRLLEAKLDSGHPVYAMWVGCGTHTLTTSRAPTSEVTMVVVVKGDRNVYTLQWSERTAPTSSPPTPDLNLWSQRLALVSPLQVCRLKPEEAAPYESCVVRP